MATILKTKLIRIGNSRGLRLPKTVLKQAGLDDEVELEVRNQSVIIRAAIGPRGGWEDQFRLMAERGDDRLVPGDANVWDDEEWEW